MKTKMGYKISEKMSCQERQICGVLLGNIFGATILEDEDPKEGPLQSSLSPTLTVSHKSPLHNLLTFLHQIPTFPPQHSSFVKDKKKKKKRKKENFLSQPVLLVFQGPMYQSPSCPNLLLPPFSHPLLLLKAQNH